MHAPLNSFFEELYRSLQVIVALSGKPKQDSSGEAWICRCS